MQIKEVCQKADLTKKAIEYYYQSGLVNPQILDNGYRDFSNKDIEKLKKISLYRKLGLNISDIKSIMETPSLLTNIVYKKSLELQQEQEKQTILKKLCNGNKLEDVEQEINDITGKSTILQKLLEMFPSCYGKIFTINFAYYLNGRIETEEQKQAFDEVVRFLDNAPNLEIPKDLQCYLDECTSNFGINDITKIIKEKEEKIKNYEEFIQSNKNMLKQYIEYKKTDEYKNSPANKLMELIKQFCQSSGYYNKFIPAMRRLSPQYNKYYERMLEVNKKFIKYYPEIKDW